MNRNELQTLILDLQTQLEQLRIRSERDIRDLSQRIDDTIEATRNLDNRGIITEVRQTIQVGDLVELITDYHNLRGARGRVVNITRYRVRVAIPRTTRGRVRDDLIESRAHHNVRRIIEAEVNQDPIVEAEIVGEQRQQ
jgi:hypothetical protein